MANKFVLISITAFLAIFNPLASSFVLHNEHDSKVKFGYSGPSGPGRWADLSPAFSECAKGKSQSPVNILTHSNAIVHTNYKPLLIHYAKSVNSTLINYGFNVGIRYGAEAGMIVLDGKNYTLKQMHWHAPSEHRIDGVQFAAELHLVHFAVADHTLAVIAVLFQLGHRPDPTLAKIGKHLITLPRESSSSSSKQDKPMIPLGKLNTHQIRKLLHSHKYYKYFGSLTTPPCTEHVTWAVLPKIHSISERQIEALRAPLEATCKKNSRPVQPLYGRKLRLYEAHHHHN
nr:alpha carbonic anhydrase 1, chloroplastic [Ipomoea batatas]